MLSGKQMSPWNWQTADVYVTIKVVVPIWIFKRFQIKINNTKIICKISKIKKQYFKNNEINIKIQWFFDVVYSLLSFCDHSSQHI